jgi:hypothetical protein
MSTGATGQTPGAIYELVTRGEKDKYFFASPAAGAFSPFANQTAPIAPHISETKVVGPISAAAFGRTVEFELERFGDILTDLWLTIQLPSWVPPSLPESAIGAEAAAYKYVTAAGFFAVEHIEILQGQMSVAQASGDILYLTAGIRRSGAQADLVREIGSVSGIARPSTARIRIPFPGCQEDKGGSFPLCALPDKTYRVRCRLRRFEELLADCALGSPLGKTFGNWTAAAIIGAPDVHLEVTQAYISADAKRAIQIAAEAPAGIQIPFVSWTEQAFQLRADGRKPYRIEGRGPSEGLVFYGRSRGAASLVDLSTAVIATAGLTIGGREREEEWSTTSIWGDVASHARMSTAGSAAIGIINWSLGDVYRSSAATRRPEGTLNFSEADKPTLYLTPVADYTSASAPVMVHVAVEGWRIYEIGGGGYGRVTFA